jgi:hypothetical protein
LLWRFNEKEKLGGKKRVLRQSCGSQPTEVETEKKKETVAEGGIARVKRRRKKKDKRGKRERERERETRA